MSLQIIVLSDGETWEGFNPDSIRVLTVSDQAHALLCDGLEPNDLVGDEIEKDESLLDLMHSFAELPAD